MAEALPLTGLRVLDLSRVLAGPFCTMNLADLGAEVIKVERPEVGDETRSWGPPDQAGISSYFLSINRNKRSIAVDLSTERGRDLIRELSSDADVVIENFKVGGAAAMGLGYEDLREANAGLIYCSISGFGSARVPADRPGYDLIVQAESGLMSITGSSDGPPNRVGVALVDVLTGQQAAIGILSALHERERTGKGQLLEVSLLDASIASLVNIAQNALATGADPPRIGPSHPSIVPYQLFEASDGHLMVAAANDPAFERLCVVIGLDDLASDARFSTNHSRVENREELVPLLSARFLERGVGEWLDLLAEQKIPCGKVRGVHDAIGAAAEAGDPVTVEVEVDSPSGTREQIQLIRQPIRFLSDPSEPRLDPPPRLGEHTVEILTEMGLSSEETTDLIESGVVSVPPPN